jgi:hypothetical protein
MIPCTDFIPAYSEMFKYLETRGGKGAVLDFWAYLSDNFLDNLREEAAKNGVRGCWNYWSHTLNEEAADFTMTVDDEEGTFGIVMHHCPSKGRLLEMEHLEPYRDYCEHCDLLYRRVLEPLGFTCHPDFSGVDQARCSIVIRKQS